MLPSDIPDVMKGMHASSHRDWDLADELEMRTNVVYAWHV